VLRSLPLFVLLACGGKADDTSTPTPPPAPTHPTTPTEPPLGTADTGSAPLTPPDTAPTALTGDTGTPATFERFEPVIDQILIDLASNDAPGVSIAIMEDGVVTWAAGFGSARPDSEVPVDEETLFQLGSTTKMYTSLALLQQVERGSLTVDTPLSTPLVGWDMANNPGSFDQITMHHLMTHQGAFYDFIDWTSMPRDSYLEEWMAAYAEELWLMAEPGQFMNYSNPNFMFGGLVLEQIDDQERSYGELVEQDVFAPLGMPRTFFKKADAEADGHYALGRGLDVNTGLTIDFTLDDVADNASGRPAGECTWSTPAQQLRMAAFLMQGDPAVLDDTLREQMVDRHVAMLEANDTSYGYGLFVSDGVYLGNGYHPVEVWSHGGNSYGYTSDFYVVPSTGFAISIMSSGWAQDFSGTVAVAMEQLADLPPAGPAPEWAFDPDRLDDHVGTYADVANGSFTVSRSGDGLQIDWPFLAQYGYTVAPDLLPIGDSLWVADLGAAAITLAFVGEPGQPSAYAANRVLVGNRVDEPVVARHAQPLAPRLVDPVPALFRPAAERAMLRR